MIEPPNSWQAPNLKSYSSYPMPRNNKLPRRNGPENFIFRINKLWDNELLHKSVCHPDCTGGISHTL